MNSLIHIKSDKILQINEDQVNKFYQERELNKKQINPPVHLILKQQGTHHEPSANSSFKNLYRRKSLMHKLKEEESMFTSFNNSVDFDRPLAQSLLKKSTHRTVYENTLHEQNVVDDQRIKQNQIFKRNTSSQHHSSLEQHHQSLYDTGSSDSLINRLKKRSNSVQLQNSSMSFSGVRQSKGTVPLSMILKKYQQEVNKLQTQDLTHESNFMSFSKRQGSNSNPKVQENNKQNFDTFNPNFEAKQEMSKFLKVENELPDTVEKCIDKWRDLEIGQLKAERLYNRRKDIGNLQKLDQQVPVKFQSHQQQFKQQSKNKQLEALRQSYERKLKQKDDYIKELEKQNTQYKKFVVSMQKMKNTLEEFQSDQNKNSKKSEKNKNIEPNSDPEVNLKQLWRWIKSLPSKKSQQSKKQSFR